jgi:hypothetical protein
MRKTKTEVCAPPSLLVTTVWKLCHCVTAQRKPAQQVPGCSRPLPFPLLPILPQLCHSGSEKTRSKEFFRSSSYLLSLSLSLSTRVWTQASSLQNRCSPSWATTPIHFWSLYFALFLCLIPTSREPSVAPIGNPFLPVYCQCKEAGFALLIIPLTHLHTQQIVVQ